MLNFRLDLCFAHRTPPGALIQRICGPERPPGNRQFPRASSHRRGVNCFGAFTLDLEGGFGTTGNRTLVYGL
jgi:hypothetical protein